MSKALLPQTTKPTITARAAAEYLREWMHISGVTKLVSEDQAHLYFKGRDRIVKTRMEYKIEVTAQADDYFNIYERVPDPVAPGPWEWADAISVNSEVVTRGKQSAKQSR